MNGLCISCKKEYISCGNLHSWGFLFYDVENYFGFIRTGSTAYTPYTWLIDSWTPAGMLSMNLSDSVSIRGNLWMDWHIAPQDPS